MIFKLVAGVIGRSQALQADAVESLGDVAAQTVVLFSLRISSKPTDWDHPYGHGRAESIATGIVAIMIAAAGVLILGRTVYSVFRPSTVEVPGLIALAAVIVVIVVKEGLHQVTLRVARRHRSSVLTASAKDHRKDALTSVATLIGIGGARIGFPLLDPLAAGFTSLIILKLAADIAGTAGRELMDRVPEDETMRGIRGVAEETSGVAHADVRARRLGPNLFVDVKIDVDPNLTVVGGHDIAKSVKARIIEQVDGVADVMVHINPHLHGPWEES
jgi:cation diffusion facilitator family transporter